MGLPRARWRGCSSSSREGPPPRHQHGREAWLPGPRDPSLSLTSLRAFAAGLPLPPVNRETLSLSSGDTFYQPANQTPRHEDTLASGCFLRALRPPDPHVAGAAASLPGPQPQRCLHPPPPHCLPAVVPSCPRPLGPPASVDRDLTGLLPDGDKDRVEEEEGDMATATRRLPPMVTSGHSPASCDVTAAPRDPQHKPLEIS